jgi:hypothetical protein
MIWVLHPSKPLTVTPRSLSNVADEYAFSNAREKFSALAPETDDGRDGYAELENPLTSHSSVGFGTFGSGSGVEEMVGVALSATPSVGDDVAVEGGSVFVIQPAERLSTTRRTRRTRPISLSNRC